uniref:Uncharacterized protein n=1 Tax=Rhizophora mucronata TaxID=61149 RepID=A0A2P2P2Q6_RHIMU
MPFPAHFRNHPHAIFAYVLLYSMEKGIL